MTLPTSRKRRARLPLAEMSMFSLTLAPLNSERVDAGLTLDESLPSPGFQTNMSSPAPVRRAESLPVAADQQSSPSPPVMRVVARAAVEGELDQASQAVAGLDDVVAAVGVEDEVLGGADVESERGGIDDDRSVRARRWL